MIKHIITILILIIILFTGRQFYTISNSYIRKQNWKYSDGFHIGDALNLKKRELIGDTIYKENKPIAIIKKRGYRFIIPNYMIIQSIETNETGYYCEK